MRAHFAVVAAIVTVPAAAFAQQAAPPPPPPANTPHVPLVIESIGRTEEIAEFTGSVVSTHRVGRYGGIVRTSDPDGPTLCTTPCTLAVAPGQFKFISRGESLLTTVYSVAVPPTGLRIRIGAASRGAVAGGRTLIAFAVALDLTGLALMAFAGSHGWGSFADGELATGIAMLGSSVVLGAGGSVLLALNPSGIASSEPIRETVLPTVVIGSLNGGGATVRFGWRF